MSLDLQKIYYIIP